MALCGYVWGDFKCALSPHAVDVPHHLVWANTEDDRDPRDS